MNRRHVLLSRGVLSSGAGLTLAVVLLSAPVFAQQPTPPATAEGASAPAPVAEPAPVPADPSAPSGPVVDTVVITASPTPQVDAAPTAPAPTPQTAPVRTKPVDARQRTAPVIPPPATIDSSAAPIASPWWVMGTIDHRWNTSPAFDLYAGDDVTQFYGLALGYDVLTLRDERSLSLPETFALNVELGWNAGGTTRDDFSSGFERAELFAHNVHVAVTGRYAILPWLAPHVRMSLGLSIVDMELGSSQDGTSFKDSVIAPLFGVGIGASLQTGPRALASRGGELSSLRLGVRFELGYTFAGSAGFALKGDDNVRVPVAESSLGGLPRSGPSIHTAVFVRL